jgi:hypothetical protein
MRVASKADCADFMYSYEGFSIIELNCPEKVYTGDAALIFFSVADSH